MRATCRLVLAGIAVLGLVAASCSDDDDAASTTTAAEATTTAAAATTAAAPSTSAAVTTTAQETTTTAVAAATTTAGTTTTTAKVGATGEIQVLAATSLTKAFNDLGAAFTAANPDAKANFVFAGSNDLATTVN